MNLHDLYYATAHSSEDQFADALAVPSHEPDLKRQVYTDGESALRYLLTHTVRACGAAAGYLYGVEKGFLILKSKCTAVTGTDSGEAKLGEHTRKVDHVVGEASSLPSVIDDAMQSDHLYLDISTQLSDPQWSLIMSSVMAEGVLRRGVYWLVPINSRELGKSFIVVVDPEMDAPLDVSARLSDVFDALELIEKRETKRLDFPIENEQHLAQFLSGMLSNCAFGVVTVDADYRVTLFNRAACFMFGVRLQDALGCYLYEFIPKQGVVPTPPCNNKHSVHSVKVVSNVHGRRANGQRFLIDLTLFSASMAGESYTTLLIDDVSARMQISREHQQSLQRFKVLTNLAPVGIIQVNTHWECVYINDRWCEGCGLSQEEILGMNWVNSIHPEDLEPTLYALRECINNGTSFQREFRLRTPLNRVTHVAAQARVLYEESGGMSGFLLCAVDITDRLAHEQQLREMAEVDSLTGLGNRALFLKRLDTALSHPDRTEPVGVFLIDLDGFKMINDTLGHDAGDELLKEVAARLTKSVRHSDLVARLGGDEFTVLLDYPLSIVDMESIAKQIISRLCQPIRLEEQEVFVTASIGISCSDYEANTAALLLKQADTAMYFAKFSGKNTWRFFSRELDTRNQERMRIDNRLHHALKDEEFFPVLQPQYSLSENGGDQATLVGFEVLLRWEDDELGMMNPSEFIPRLEETGLIIPAANFVFERVCQGYKTLCSRQPWLAKLPIAVNFSGQQLTDPRLLMQTLKTIEVTEFPLERLVIEITESSLLEENEHCESFLHDMRQRGATIALDDFGTGYSSFVYLKRYPISYIKIDRVFIQSCDTNGQDQAILKSIIEMAHNLGLKVVAEGVETQAQLDVLKGFGCDTYQGYLFSKPLPLDQVEYLCEHDAQHRASA